MRVLFVKDSLAWPRTSGHDVHCYHMMRALQDRGHTISLLTADECSDEAVAGLNLEIRTTFAELPVDNTPFQLPKLQEKFCSYWGTDRNRISGVGRLATEHAFDAVVVVGLSVLPYLARVPKSIGRIWYAADEWFLHHLSQWKPLQRHTWGEWKQGITKGLYEFAFTGCTDRVWVVSSMDARAVRCIMPRSRVDVIANGVDAQHFDPKQFANRDGMPDSSQPPSLVFWGRLDFGPNLDAVRWFGENVWPSVRNRIPGIQWTVYGFKAESAIRDLQSRFEFELIPDLPDLRGEIVRHDLVVLPFVSGAGIKNKFLEAAAMARPIIASPRALNGVELFGCEPCHVARSPKEWVDTISATLNGDQEGAALGSVARRWVIDHYSWDRAGELATESFDKLPSTKPSTGKALPIGTARGEGSRA